MDLSRGTAAPTVLLGCTACSRMWAPTCADGSPDTPTGCPRCGGWTWLVTIAAHAVPQHREPEEPAR